MRTTKRTNAAGIIQQLLDEPYRFEFFQAIKLIEKLLVEKGIPPAQVLTDYLRFRNSTRQGFPASQIEALDIETSADTAISADEACLISALERGELNRICITPAFFGLLGNHGALPSHYSDRIVAQLHTHKNSGAQAYFDLFSNRLVALFYQAWRKHRLELTSDKTGKPALMPILLSIAGSKVHAVPDEVVAYYASAFAQRPVSALMIGRVLSDYLNVPIQVRSNVGRWEQLDACHETRLGVVNTTLSAGAMLGGRMWRRDLLVGIRIGPLDKAQYEDFLREGKGAEALRDILAMFDTPTLRYEIQLVLRASEVKGITLGGDTGAEPARLGVDAFLVTGGAESDRDDIRYTLGAMLRDR
jgi:type VI secretion system protein ImpH